MGYVFVFFPGVEYRSKFTLEYSLKLSIVCLHTSVEKNAFLLHVACGFDYTLYPWDSS